MAMPLTDSPMAPMTGDVFVVPLVPFTPTYSGVAAMTGDDLRVQVELLEVAVLGVVCPDQSAGAPPAISQHARGKPVVTLPSGSGAEGHAP